MQVTIKPKEDYAEESQPNPLRWYILRQTAPECFENVSAPIVCKDFFNDLAYTLQTNKSFSIYGFNAGVFKLPKDKPVYMLLTHTTEQFERNICSVLNPWLLENQCPMIGMMKVDNGLLISFTPWYFKNVYRISLVSLIIRLLNIDHKFDTFKEVVAYKKFPTKDQLKWNIVVAKNLFFNIPKKLDSYLWYCGPEYNSKTYKEGYQLSSFVHNNGVLEWSQHM